MANNKPKEKISAGAVSCVLAARLESLRLPRHECPNAVVCSGSVRGSSAGWRSRPITPRRGRMTFSGWTSVVRVAMKLLEEGPGEPNGA